MSIKNKTILVTGISSGIGRTIATTLASQGARVFGTARDPGVTAPIEGVKILAMDVTDDGSVAEAVHSIVSEAGPVQHLVNSAGYALFGALEETSLAEARHQFDTNFFGVLRVTNAVLPNMREAGEGRVVNISSVLGFLPGPYWGIYAASKHAIEGYTESLDHETRRFGVRALLIEPAYAKTNIAHNAITTRRSLSEYAAERQRVTEGVAESVKNGDEPQLVADAVLKALTARTPKLRYPVGKGKTLSLLRRYVPASLFEKSFRKQIKID